MTLNDAQSHQKNQRKEGRLHRKLLHTPVDRLLTLRRKRSSSSAKVDSNQVTPPTPPSKRDVSDKTLPSTLGLRESAVALPHQTVISRALADDEGASAGARTSQGLTLEEVTGRLRHPNAGVRKDALGGLREIVGLQPDGEVGTVVRALGGMLSDEV